MEDYRHIDIDNLELDFYYPQYKLAFEYQGHQHYSNRLVFHQSGTLDDNQRRDLQKSSICKDKGITLIQVPYWWDRKLESLAATVYTQRPDLFNNSNIPSGSPIPILPNYTNSKLLQSKKRMIMTATEWDYDTMDPTGWYMSEKYDGMRLYWDGSQFYSRSGEIVSVPNSISTGMPSVPLDGELWTQYGLYQDAVSLSRSSKESKWRNSTFWVFDSPSNLPFEVNNLFNINQMLKLILGKNTNVENIKCSSFCQTSRFYLL